MRVFLQPCEKAKRPNGKHIVWPKIEAVFEWDEAVIKKRPKIIWPDRKKKQAKFAAGDQMLFAAGCAEQKRVFKDRTKHGIIKPMKGGWFYDVSIPDIE